MATFNHIVSNINTDIYYILGYIYTISISYKVNYIKIIEYNIKVINDYYLVIIVNLYVFINDYYLKINYY